MSLALWQISKQRSVLSIRLQVKCEGTLRCVVRGLMGKMEGAIVIVAISHVVHFSQTFEAPRVWFSHD